MNNLETTYNRIIASITGRGKVRISAKIYANYDDILNDAIVAEGSLDDKKTDLAQKIKDFMNNESLFNDANYVDFIFTSSGNSKPIAANVRWILKEGFEVKQPKTEEQDVMPDITKSANDAEKLLGIFGITIRKGLNGTADLGDLTATAVEYQVDKIRQAMQDEQRTNIIASLTEENKTLKKEIEGLEKELEARESEIEQLHEDMQDPKKSLVAVGVSGILGNVVENFAMRHASAIGGLMGIDGATVQELLSQRTQPMPQQTQQYETSECVVSSVDETPRGQFISKVTENINAMSDDELAMFRLAYDYLMRDNNYITVAQNLNNVEIN